MGWPSFLPQAYDADVDDAAREALAALIRAETRVELAGDFHRIAIELKELRLRVELLETLAGVPTGMPVGVRLRQRAAAPMRDQGDSFGRIASELRISMTTVKNDIAPKPRPPPPRTGTPPKAGGTARSDRPPTAVELGHMSQVPRPTDSRPLLSPREVAELAGVSHLKPDKGTP